jgi:uncharacterized protein (DUF4415 family)
MATRKRPNPELIDDENPEWTQEDFARAKRFSQLPKDLQHTLRRVRGAQKEPTKERITIRLSPDVLQRFRESGPGWQTRVDEALRSWLRRNSPGA